MNNEWMHGYNNEYDIVYNKFKSYSLKLLKNNKVIHYNDTLQAESASVIILFYLVIDTQIFAEL